MGVTINVNGLSLCHKASGGFSAATIPDVCKTPSPGGPVPIPYPNIATEQDLAKGTTTVKADGGNMCANYGSEFSRSTGDEPGTVGGVLSGTFIKEATWITYSFDVKLEGKGACRLTDKMFHNHQNTVNLAGKIHSPLPTADDDIIKCILEMCKKDKDVVEKTKRLKISTENSRKMSTFKYIGDGQWQKVGSWTTAGTANPATREVTMTRDMPCSEIQRTIHHEVTHTDQKNMGPLEAEIDAYAKEEQWAIDRGLPESSSNFRKKLPNGKSVPDVDKVKQMLNRDYGYNLQGGPQVRGSLNEGRDVWLSDRTTRPAKPGDKFSRMDPRNQNLNPQDIPPDRLKCP